MKEAQGESPSGLPGREGHCSGLTAEVPGSAQLCSRRQHPALSAWGTPTAHSGEKPGLTSGWSLVEKNWTPATWRGIYRGKEKGLRSRKAVF